MRPEATTLAPRPALAARNGDAVVTVMATPLRAWASLTRRGAVTRSMRPATATTAGGVAAGAATAACTTGAGAAGATSRTISRTTSTGRSTTTGCGSGFASGVGAGVGSGVTTTGAGFWE